MNEALFLVLFLSGWCALLLIAGAVAWLVGRIVRAWSLFDHFGLLDVFRPASIRDEEEYKS